MTHRPTALLAAAMALCVACGDAVSTAPAGDAGSASDGATDAAAGDAGLTPASVSAAWCARAAGTIADEACPMTWPPTGQTTVAPAIAVRGFPSEPLLTVEQCLDAPLSLTPAQLAFVRTCDLRRLMQTCAPTVADGGVCSVRFVSCAWVQNVYRAAARATQCW